MTFSLLQIVTARRRLKSKRLPLQRRMYNESLLNAFTEVNVTFPLTLKEKVSLKTGLSVFLWTFVSNFFFLSGRTKTFTYGSEVPPLSMERRSAACRIPTVSWGERKKGEVLRMAYLSQHAGRKRRYAWYYWLESMFEGIPTTHLVLLEVVIDGILQLPELFFLLHLFLFLVSSQSGLHVVLLVIILLLFLQRQKG